jgi:hypothetical protein
MPIATAMEMKDQAAVPLACEAFQSGLDIAGRARRDGERLHAWR